MDGISGTVSLGILFCCLLAILMEKNSGSFDFLLLLGVSGAIIGFLAFNWHPASIYMGDTGSQFLGAFIAAVSVHLLWNYRDAAGPAIQFRQYIIPLIAFSVPIIDTTTVVFRRIARGQSPFIGGRDHISHHFVYAGLTDKQVICLLGGMSFLSAIIAAIVIVWHDHISTGITMMLYGYFVILFLLAQFFYNAGSRKEKNRRKPAIPIRKSSTA